jgi:hypothetical protein
MQNNTRFNIDEVWFIHPKQEQCITGKVVKISIEVLSMESFKPSEQGFRSLISTGEYKEDRINTKYLIKTNREEFIKEDYKVYSTKEELIKSLD